MRRLLGFHGFFLFGPDVGLSALPQYLIELLLELFGPGPLGGGHALQRLVVLVEEVLRQLVQVVAVLELSDSDLRLVLEVAVLVEDLVHLVLDLSLKVQVSQQLRDNISNVLVVVIASRSLTAALWLHHFVFNCFFDGPEHIRVLNILEYKLALLLYPETHIGAADSLSQTVIKTIVHFFLINILLTYI